MKEPEIQTGLTPQQMRGVIALIDHEIFRYDREGKQFMPMQDEELKGRKEFETAIFVSDPECDLAQLDPRLQRLEEQMRRLKWFMRMSIAMYATLAIAEIVQLFLTAVR